MSKPLLSLAVFPPWAGPPATSDECIRMFDYFERYSYTYMNVEGRSQHQVRILLLQKAVGAGIVAKEYTEKVIAELEYNLVEKARASYKLTKSHREARHKIHNNKHLQRRLSYWRNRVPENVAIAQTSWERRQAVWRVYSSQKHLTFRLIGLSLGLTVERVRQMIIKVEREKKHPAALKRGYLVSPVERYFEESPLCDNN